MSTSTLHDLPAQPPASPLTALGAASRANLRSCELATLANFWIAGNCTFVVFYVILLIKTYFWIAKGMTSSLKSKLEETLQELRNQ